jgi:hypothetical protein
LTALCAPMGTRDMVSLTKIAGKMNHCIWFILTLVTMKPLSTGIIFMLLVDTSFVGRGNKEAENQSSKLNARVSSVLVFRFIIEEVG